MNTFEISLLGIGALVIATIGALLLTGYLPAPYHWRNLFVRKTTTGMTILVVAAVVGTFSWLLSFASALSRSLAVAAEDTKLIVLQTGSLSEANSGLPPDDFNKLMRLQTIAKGSHGQTLISPEMLVQVSLPRTSDNGLTRANVAVRGVTDVAFAVHTNVHPLGQQFSTGSPEVIVGKKAAQQFSGLQVGENVKLGFAGNREYKVVGLFSADGGPMESEIWAYLPSLQSAYGRTAYSSAAVRVAAGVDPASVVKEIQGPGIELSAQTERDYWQSQSQNIRTYQFICYILIAMMSLAAIFSIANTMFAAVAGRSREIAMLRTIGFSKTRILLGFMVESIFLSVLGGAVGLAACAGYLQLAGNTKDMFGANTFTTLAFELNLTPTIIGIAIVSVTFVGAIGALAPAVRAARTQVIEALREA